MRLNKFWISWAWGGGLDGSLEVTKLDEMLPLNPTQLPRTAAHRLAPSLLAEPTNAAE